MKKDKELKYHEELANLYVYSARAKKRCPDYEKRLEKIKKGFKSDKDFEEYLYSKYLYKDPERALTEEELNIEAEKVAFFSLRILAGRKKKLEDKLNNM